VTSVTVNGRLVVTFNEVGLAAAVAGLGLVSMTVGAARKEISEGSDVKLRFEMKLLQASESCNRSHSDLAALAGLIPAKMLVTRNLTIWSAASYSTQVARNDRFGCVA
jgi:hypothetical protein